MKGFFISILILIVTVRAIGQTPANDDCINATELCANESISVSNQNATIDVCPGCSDGAATGGNACFSLDNTIWFSFTTNQNGGNVSVDLSGLNCIIAAGQSTAVEGVIYEATVPCDESSYTVVSNCNTSATTLNLSATGLQANTTYYVQIDGDMSGAFTSPAECTFDIVVSGSAVENVNTVTLTSSDNNVCESTALVLTAESPDCDNVDEYIWYEDGNFLSSTTDSILNYQALTDVSLTVEVVCGSATSSCNTTTTSNNLDLVVTEVEVDAGPDHTIISGSSAELTGSGNGSFLWSPDQDLSSTNTANTVASPGNTTIYSLTVTTPEGCTESDDVLVEVVPPIIAPNIITPNDDGINDTWIIVGIDKFPSATVAIYDRWGQRIFNSTGYGQPDIFDGTFAGKKLPASTYYYHVDLNTGDDDFDNIQGFIELVY